MADKKSTPKRDESRDDDISFGRYLKALRLEKGISIETVAAETRIHLKTLELIEAEDHERLPDEIFVKGFIRSYAKLLGANPAEMIQRYLASCHVRRQNARFNADLLRARQRFWPRLIFSLVTLTGLLIVSAMVMMPYSDEETPSVEQRPPATRVARAGNLPTADTTNPAKNPTTAPAAPHALIVTAVKETWVKIIVDEQRPKTYSLNPGDHLELTARKGFNLLIGNASGITLKLNNKPVRLSGGQGQMVTIRLP